MPHKMTMKAYRSSKTVCAKCGAQEYYRWGSGRWSPPVEPGHDTRFCSGCSIERSEHMHRTCFACGHEWAESCITEPVVDERILPSVGMLEGVFAFVLGILTGVFLSLGVVLAL